MKSAILLTFTTKTEEILCLLTVTLCGCVPLPESQRKLIKARKTGFKIFTFVFKKAVKLGRDKKIKSFPSPFEKIVDTFPFIRFFL